MVDDTIANNTSAGSGGGIENDGMLMIENSTIADNTAASGGGIADEGILFTANVTIADNAATGGSGSGGGLDVSAEGTATLYNTIVAQNTDSSGGGDIAGAGITAMSSNNLVGTDDSGTVAASVNAILLDGGSAHLGLLANYGGPTPTIALEAGSPAIDAGSNSSATAFNLATDQRGAVRGGQSDAVNAGSTVDIGAYEASSSYLVTTTADSTAIGTLRSAILWADLSTNANPANLASPQPNTIDFDIPTSDPGYQLGTIPSWTITPTAPLPAISASTTINGYSQPGFGPATLNWGPIVLSGTDAGQGADGLDLTGNDVSVLGLFIDGFSGDGINVASSDDRLQDLGVGLSPSLDSARANGVGIYITGADNLIGTDGQDGSFQDGVEINVILGNLGPGIWVSGSGATGNVIAGDWTCCLADGQAFPNEQAGLLIDDGASNNWVGVNTVYGPESADEADHFTSNGGPGIQISGAGTTGNVVAGNTITAMAATACSSTTGRAATGSASIPRAARITYRGQHHQQQHSGGRRNQRPRHHGQRGGGEHDERERHRWGVIDNGASNNWIGLGPQEEPGGSLQGTSPFGSGMPLMGDVLNGDGNAGVEMSGQGTSGNVVAGDLINSNTSEGVYSTTERAATG